MANFIFKFLLTTQNKLVFKQFVQIMALLLSATITIALTACAKKPSGVRTIKQSNGVAVNPAVSTPSIDAATAQSLFYEMTSVSRPDEEKKITLEIKLPDGFYLPITTDHSTTREAYGIYEDKTRSTKLEFRARCNDDLCSKYTLLMTVIKNGYALHQTAVVSFRNSCFFNVENINVAVTSQLYKNLNSIEEKFQTHGVVESNECPNEP